MTSPVVNRVEIWQIQIVTSMGNMAMRKGYLLAPERVEKITGFIRQKCRMASIECMPGTHRLLR